MSKLSIISEFIIFLKREKEVVVSSNNYIFIFIWIFNCPH